MISLILKNKKSFTLVEVMVATLIGIIVIEAAYLFFPIGSRISREGEAVNEMTQDARVVLNRIKRELRQSPQILSSLPDNRDDGISLLSFEDGFPEDSDTDPHYIRYQKTGSLYQRITYHYIDSENPTTIVSDSFANAEEVIENTEDIAENLNTIKIYLADNIIKIYIKLSKQNESITLLAGVYPRNSQI